jgi:hypothetical protein
MRGQVKEAQQVRKVVFLQISWVRAARARRVTFVAWAAYCLRGLTLVGRNGRGGTKNKGGRTLVGRNRLQKSAVHSLASRRQKPRPCLAPAMTQGAKNYKVRQPPPFRALKFASAKTRLAPSPTPQLHHQSDRSGLHPSVEVSIGIDIISIVPFRAQLCRDARFSVLYWEGKH